MRNHNNASMIRRLLLVVSFCLPAILSVGCLGSAPDNSAFSQPYDAEEHVAGQSAALSKSSDGDLPDDGDDAVVAKNKTSKYAVDENGCIAKTKGKRTALTVEDVFEAYAPSNNNAAPRLIGTGGNGGFGGGGRLNAWGCWTGSCCSAGHYEACAIGWCWVCDAWVDCERCIWPY